MKASITITFSKIVAFLVLGVSVYLSIFFDDKSIFTFSLPFVSAMIAAKQVIDKTKKQEK